MNALLPYVRELERELSAPRLAGAEWESWCDRCLDGGPSRELRAAVQRADLRKQGAFFTGPELGRRAALAFGPPTADESVYFDPACGTGDLLLAAAGRLPRDRHRAVATIVLGRRAVAVENHVIVCLPGDGTIERCRALLARLHSGNTDGWLNRRIRCRHLTTSAVAGIPWWDEP